MRRFATSVLFLAAAGAPWASSRAADGPLAQAPPPAQGPAPGVQAPAILSVERDLIDLGEVTRGTKTEATFVLRNTGTRPVKILSARPG